MKLSEYLKQFEGLDPEMEVYFRDPFSRDYRLFATTKKPWIAFIAKHLSFPLFMYKKTMEVQINYKTKENFDIPVVVID